MSLTELMSMIFSDKAVYYDGEKYVYAPILENVKKHDYDIDSIVTDEETGTKTYADASGRTALKGIDVSEWQGYIDWAKVKADGVQFAFIRAGLRGYESGTIYEDTRVRENLEGATANGIPIGMYFYTQAANTREAVE
ncbi:MAG: Lyzozyme M1 (1,4-beta-N-acetylmuramidase), partial [Oscillospiraceae bacterium]|nr:Lyzozyme M1 (1,4-beta-N-acetylmuramidase) [Oscillospiraceae bacterium]